MKILIILTALMIGSTVHAEESEFNKAFEKFVLDNDTITLQTKPAYKQGVTIVTVGIDNTCDYQNLPIQNAIDDGFVHIRVVGGTYTENLNIDNTNMIIEGGYENCVKADANDLSGGTTTTINGSGDNTVSTITVSGSDDTFDIELRRLTVRNGGTASLAFGGGIVFANSVANAFLDQLVITNNTANFGGGLSVIFGAPTVNIFNTNFVANNANSGGAISCGSATGVINFYDSGNPAFGTMILNNAVLRDGGGAELFGGCTLNMYSGQNPDSVIDVRGFLSNTAATNGGAVSVKSGSKFNAIGFQFLAGNNDGPVSFVNNSADDSGGAVYAEGEDTEVLLYNVNVAGNAASDGGGVTIAEGAIMTTGSVTFVFPCWSPGKCNRFVNNDASDRGGAFFVTQESDLGTDLKVYTSQIYENTSGANGGAVSYTRGTNSTTLIEGSMIYDNDSSTILYNFTNASSTYQFNTIADNIASISIIRNFQGTSKLASSIVHNQDATNVYSSSAPVGDTFDCLITSEDSSFSGTLVSVADPQFVDRNGDDYHINAFLSPAVDYCDTIITTPDIPTDIDNETRGWDDYVTVNIGSRFWDVGADETYQNDVIFEDGLE